MLSDGGPHAPKEVVPAEPGCGVQIRKLERICAPESGVLVPGSTDVSKRAPTPFLARSDSGPRTSTAEMLVKAPIDSRNGGPADPPCGMKRTRTSWLRFRKFAKNPSVLKKVPFRPGL